MPPGSCPTRCYPSSGRGMKVRFGRGGWMVLDRSEVANEWMRMPGRGGDVL